ncbi:MAG: hypothetical protein AMXMBFR83_03970 [Phycisphaerae bacterium]
MRADSIVHAVAAGLIGLFAWVASTGCDRHEAEASPPRPVRPASAPSASAPAGPFPSTGAPATSPTTTAPVRSAQTHPAGAAPAFEPLADAVAGEWADYAALDGREIRYDVTRAGPGVVHVRITVRQDGRLLGLPAERQELRDLDPLARQAASATPLRGLSAADLQAGGRSWKAMLFEDRWVDEGVAYVRRTWVHPEVPVYGLLRMELLGDGRLEARLELKGFGKP